MAYCVKCGQELPNDARFCANCGTPVEASRGENQTERQQEYAGKIVKCPVCGENLPALTAICPACGHEINSAKLSPALKEFIDEINECDKTIANTPQKEIPKKGWKSWKKSIRILWVILNIFTSCIPLVIYLTLPLFRPLLKISSVPELSPTEQRKVALIENFTFPNERESLLEALLFIKAKMAFIASEKTTEKNVFWLRLWNTKAAQLHQKAKILLSNDTVAENAYSEITSSKNAVDKRIRIRAGIGAGIITVFIAFLMLNGSLLAGITNITPNNNGVSSSMDSHTNDKFEWLESGLSTKVPKIEVDKGVVHTNSDTELWLSFDGVPYNQFEKYVADCQELGYTVDVVKDTHTFTAFNSEGYLLEVSASGERLSIELKAPLVGDENFEWPSDPLAVRIPEIQEKTGRINYSDADTLKMEICGITTEEFKTYIGACTDAGFIIDTEQDSDSFEGFDSDGYKLRMWINETKTMTIELESPMQMSEFDWPTLGIAKNLPKPKSNVGNITWNQEDTFTIYVGNTAIDEFNAYVDKCLSSGFDVKYSRSDKAFYAKNGSGDKLDIHYSGFNTMYINIYNWG